MRVLFSSIGNRDPINLLDKDLTSGEDHVFTEGSLLQTIRLVKPDVIYLYMSQTVSHLDDKDDRYEKSIRELYKYLEMDVSIEKIKKEDLDRPHDFDFFIEEYPPLLDKIYYEHKKPLLYVNISSGTPAMKNALCFAASVSAYKIHVVQVDVPIPGGESKSEEEASDLYDHKLVNESILRANEMDIRAYYPSLKNINYERKKLLIIENIEQYNYRAAWTIAKTATGILDDSVISLIEAAYYKSVLDNDRKEDALRRAHQTFDEYRKPGWSRHIVDYLLYLALNLRRGLLLDFFRGLTPYIVNVFELYLKEVLTIDLERYTDEDESGIRRFDQDKLEQDSVGRRIYSILMNEFMGDFNFNKPLSSVQLVPIIDGFSGDADFVEKCRELRDIEEDVRDPVAHNIVSLNADSVNVMTDKRPAEILKLCQEVLEACQLDLPPGVWRTYDKINEQIITQI